MSWYVLATSCGKEEILLSILQRLGISSKFDVFCPKRKIGWRKNGNIISIIRPLFEGYLFAEVDGSDISEFDYLLRRYKLRAWIVRSAGSLVPISVEEKQIIEKLMDSERVVQVSRIDKSKNQIKVVDGPLVGMEHIIRKFSNKNRRVTIEVPILHDNRTIELEGILVGAQQNSLHKDKV